MLKLKLKKKKKTYCKKTGKRCFKDKIEATMHCIRFNYHGNHHTKHHHKNKELTRVYCCEFCGHWHTTTQKYKKKDDN